MAYRIIFDKKYTLQDKIDYLERYMISFTQYAQDEEEKGDLIERDAWLKHHNRYWVKHKGLLREKALINMPPKN